MTARVTRITATRPATLSKSFRRDANGSLVRGGGGVLVEGHAAVGQIADLPALGALLTSLGPAEALVYGVPRAGDGPLLSRNVFAARGRPASAITRTREWFQWPKGPGVMMLDYDPEPEGAPLGRSALVSMIREAVPGLADVSMLWWPSASSHIVDAQSGADLTGLRGQRLYLLVTDASDIPRAGAALVDRLWAAGKGRIRVSASGVALERSPLDASVWQPERLDFAAGAVCGPGLEQRRGAPGLIAGAVEAVDLHSALPDDPDVLSAAVAARTAARAQAKEAIEAARAAFVVRQAEAMLAPEEQADPERREAATETARRAVEHGVLAGDYPIAVMDGDGTFTTLPVKELLASRARYHGRHTRDPLEPDYDGGRATGKLFLLDARPTLFSFAHGGRSFKLLRAPVCIEAVPGHATATTDAALEALRSDPAVFDFGNQVVLVEDGRILALDEYALGHYLGGLIRFRQRRRRGEKVEETDIDPPKMVVRQILSLGHCRRLKPLTGVITAPTLRPDGSLLALAGFDEATGLLLDPRTEDVPSIADRPSPAEVREALDRLMWPFEGFPCVDAHARGALLAALLTAVVRPSLPTAPAFAIDAPVQGSGKTLLASCIAALATGRAPEILPHTSGRDDGEVRKRLFAALRGGATALVWDNVTGVLDSSALAAAITAPALTDRILGKSETVSVPNRAILAITGNNLCLAGDLSRRAITCRIDPETEAPFARQFAFDPLANVLDGRLSLATAALVIMRGRLTSGAPRAEGRMASFEVWDDLVRQTVAWVGRDVAPGRFGDPMDLVRSAQANDLELDGLHALLVALRDSFGDRWFPAKAVVDHGGRVEPEDGATATDRALEEALAAFLVDEKMRSPKSVGRILNARKDRIVRDLRLVSRQSGNAKEYRVEVLSSEPGTRFNRFNRFESAPSCGNDTADLGNEERPEPNRANRANRRQGRSTGRGGSA